MLRYCLIGYCEKYSELFDEWLKYVLKFKPLPDKIIIATEDVNFPKDPRIHVIDCSEDLVSIPVNVSQEVLKEYKLSNAREHLRRYVIKNTDYNLILYLDCEVIVKEEYFPLLMFGIMSLTNSQVFIHECPLDKINCISLTRTALSLIPFNIFGGWNSSTSYQLYLVNSKEINKHVRGRIVKIYNVNGVELESDFTIQEVYSTFRC